MIWRLLYNFNLQKIKTIELILFPQCYILQFRFIASWFKDLCAWHNALWRPWRLSKRTVLGDSSVTARTISEQIWTAHRKRKESGGEGRNGKGTRGEAVNWKGEGAFPKWTIKSLYFHMEIVLLQQLKHLLTSSSNQFGFKERHSTDQCVFTLLEICNNLYGKIVFWVVMVIGYYETITAKIPRTGENIQTI